MVERADRVSGERVEYRGEGVTLVGDRWEADPSVAGSPRGAVVLLHGGGQTRHSWSRTGQRLARDGWTVVAYDTRGHGDSGWSPDGVYTLDVLIADLKAVLATLDTKAVLVGASMGGATSLAAQGEDPDLAEALVLVDIVPRIEPEGVRRITGFMRGRPEGFATLDEVADAVAAYNPHRARTPNPDGLRKNVRLREDGRWYWHWDPAFLLNDDDPKRELRTERIVEAARNVRVPTMLVRGRQSDIVSEAGAAELLELIPGARFVDVKDAGHMVAGDDNDVFTASLAEFLDDVARDDVGRAAASR
jgi:pimeloyl-ACP methyl ester carboxylesterase